MDARKWMNFYTEVLAPFATAGGMKLTLEAEVRPPGGIPSKRLEDLRIAPRELGMIEELDLDEKS